MQELKLLHSSMSRRGGGKIYTYIEQ
jgi:hypothetical protein